MIKQFLLGITLFGFATVSWGQSLSVSTVSNTANNNTSTFTLEDGKVTFSSNQIQFLSTGNMISGYASLGISRDLSLVGAVEGSGSDGRVVVLNSKGDNLSSFEITNITPGDPSLAVYPYNNGSVLVRDNIANFRFFDTYGEIITSVSGSSQSEGGESISEVVVSPASETVIIYTPKIKSGEGLGSQAGYLDDSMSLQSLHYSTDRYIKQLEITENGQFVVFVTSSDDDNDRIHVTDRYGNKLSEISSEESLKGVQLSNNAAFVTAYSGNRVLVFDSMSGERVGSTSFRSEVLAANYFREDNTIIALTGSYNGDSGTIGNVEFHAINIEQRKVERGGYNAQLAMNEVLKTNFTRMGTNRYRFTGTNKTLEIRVSY